MRQSAKAIDPAAAHRTLADAETMRAIYQKSNVLQKTANIITTRNVKQNTLKSLRANQEIAEKQNVTHSELTNFFRSVFKHSVFYT